MTSRHFRWQLRWRINHSAARAVHDSGLVVHWRNGAAVPDDAAAHVTALAVKNGLHNAPIMLARLLREAGELFAEGEEHANS